MSQTLSEALRAIVGAAVVEALVSKPASKEEGATGVAAVVVVERVVAT